MSSQLAVVQRSLCEK